MEFINPAYVVEPLGLYSHMVKVPERSELIFISGQLGVGIDGTTPAMIGEQAELVFSNITAILASQDMDPAILLN